MAITKRTWTTAGGDISVAWQATVTDRAGNRQRRQFKTKKDAKVWLVEQESKLLAGTYRHAATQVTVHHACMLYLDYIEGRTRRGERFCRQHYEICKGRVHRYLLSDHYGLAQLKLAQLSTRLVYDFAEALRDSGITVPTARQIVGLLSRVIEHAKRNDLVSANVARGVQIVGRRDEGSRKIVAPSKEEMKLLIANADKDFVVPLKFAAATGLRAGEQWALRWKHIDLEKGFCKVESRVDAYGTEDLPKSAAGLREVPLGSEIVRMLREWRLRSKFSKPGDLVFPDRKGGYTRQSNMTSRYFRPLREKIGAPHLVWHSLRHFAVSCWIEQGFQPKTVQAYSGHSNIAITFSRYGHLFPTEDHRKAMDRIAKDLFK